MRDKAGKIIKSGKFIAVIVVIGVLAGILFAAFRFNQGADLASSTVLQIQLDHEEDVNKVNDEVAKFFIPSKVDKEGTSLYRIYFQNISSEKLKEITDKLGEGLGVIVKQSTFTLVPDQSLLLQQSVNLRILPVLFIFGLIYKLAAFRKLNLTRMDVLQFLLSDLISLVWVLSVLLGTASILGKLGVQFNRAQLLTLIMGVSLYLFLCVFVVLRFREFRKKNSEGTIAESLTKYILADWPAPVFIATVIAVIVILPYLGFGSELISTAVILVLAILAGLFAQLQLMPVLVQNTGSLFNKIKPIRNLTFLSKKW